MRRSPGTSLNLVVAPDYKALSRMAASLVLAELKKKPDLLICASAGGTPSGLYDLLVKASHRRPSLFESLRVLQIDEWLDVWSQDPASCRRDLQLKLIGPAGIHSARVFAFNGAAGDPPRECSRMARILEREGPIDICILGLGANGHVAMNEPGPFITEGVHVAKLARASQKHPLLRTVKRKPTHGLTLGMGDILRSRKILLLVSGPHKRAALARLVKGPITPLFPASLLLLHGAATVLCDSDAMSQR